MAAFYLMKVRTSINVKNLSTVFIVFGIFVYIVFITSYFKGWLFKKPKLSRFQQLMSQIDCDNNKNHSLIHDVKKTKINFIFYVLYHDNNSKMIAEKWCSCRPWAIPVLIHPSPYFESIFYIDYLPKHTAEWIHVDYIAFGTYNTIFMMGNEVKLMNYLSIASTGQYDIIPLFDSSDELLPQAILCHSSHFKVIWDTLLTSLGYTVTDIRKQDKVHSFYRNTYITTPIIMKQLIIFINKAITLVNTNKKLSKLMQYNANYKQSKQGVSIIMFNTTYYQYHPFIFERLPVFFSYYSNFTVYVSKGRKKNLKC